jgi:hypothetical protein
MQVHAVHGTEKSLLKQEKKLFSFWKIKQINLQNVVVLQYLGLRSLVFGALTGRWGCHDFADHIHAVLFDPAPYAGDDGPLLEQVSGVTGQAAEPGQIRQFHGLSGFNVAADISWQRLGIKRLLTQSACQRFVGESESILARLAAQPVSVAVQIDLFTRRFLHAAHGARVLSQIFSLAP